MLWNGIGFQKYNSLSLFTLHFILFFLKVKIKYITKSNKFLQHKMYHNRNKDSYTVTLHNKGKKEEKEKLVKLQRSDKE